MIIDIDLYIYWDKYKYEWGMDVLFLGMRKWWEKIYKIIKKIKITKGE